MSGPIKGEIRMTSEARRARTLRSTNITLQRTTKKRLITLMFPREQYDVAINRLIDAYHLWRQGGSN